MILLLFFAAPEAQAHQPEDLCRNDDVLTEMFCRYLVIIDQVGPLIDETGDPLSGGEVLLQFGIAGVMHILPGGTDHILFVLALFLTSRRCRTLLLQISAFTVAHTATLAMTASGILDPPASVVEPLIALSIAAVALEVFLRRSSEQWKLAVVFGFGLFHGMGFAGFVRELGLPQDQFWPALIGFNIGVEVGQLAVVALAVLLAGPIKRELAQEGHSYDRMIVKPAALLIAAIGLWWFISRVFGG
ncbi:MAG: HupE/UreJ family protein [Pseudomonadota bacterium]